MSKFGADLGDKVRFTFGYAEPISGILKYMPQDTGDAWIIWTDAGNIVHIQTYETMTVTNRKCTRVLDKLT